MRYVVENVQGGINDVVHFVTGLGADTDSPANAETIVVKVNDECFVSASVDDYEIHTVH